MVPELGLHCLLRLTLLLLLFPLLLKGPSGSRVEGRSPLGLGTDVGKVFTLRVERLKENVEQI